MKRTILFLTLALILCAALVVGVNAMDSTEYTWDSANNIFDFRGYSSTFVDENGTAHITAGYIVNADAEQMFKDMFGEGSNFKYGVFGAFVKRADGTLLSPLTVDKTTGSVVANYENNIPVKFCDFNTSFLDKTGTNVDRGQINAILKNIIHDEEDYRTKEVCLGIYVTNGEFVKYITSGGISDTPEVIRFADFAQGFEAIKNVNKNSGKPIALTELFETIKDDVTFNNLVVTATLDDKPKDISLTNNMLTLVDTGVWEITIYDKDLYCAPVSATVTVNPCDKLAVMFPNTDKYLYRVGNQNTIVLGSLFGAIGDFTISDLEIELTGSDNVTSTYTKNDDWTQGTIKFEGTGVVTVTASCKGGNPISLNLEVVDAVNATSATSAKSNNVVLLNDVEFSTIEVSGGYTLYGNGFKMTAANDVKHKSIGVGFVTLNNGILDNVQIICPNFSHSIIYTKNISENENQHSYDSNLQTYGNVRSAVIADGNSKIVNSYISGGRAAIYLRSGNLLVDNTTIHGGAAANIHAVSAQSLTLNDTTLIQEPLQATVHDTSKTLMGFSVLLECDGNGDSTPIFLTGTFVQSAWINESYAKYAPSSASSIIDAALAKTDYLHDLDGDGTKESLNLGFTYIPQEIGKPTTVNIKDYRKNQANIPYESVEVSASLVSAKIYSYKNTKGTSSDFILGDDYAYAPTKQMASPPALSYTDTNADRVFETTFDTSDNCWESTLTVNLDNGNYTFTFDNLLAQKYGESLDYTVTVVDGTAIDTSKAINLTASGVTNYVLTVADGDTTHTFYFTLTATKTSIPEPKVTDTTGGTPLLVVKSKNSDWSCAIPALEGIKIKYYTSANNSVILDLATLTPTSTGKQNGTENYWETTTKDGYTLKVTCGYIHDTKHVYGMPVVVNNGGNKMYFTISSTNGYVSTNTAGRTVTLTYEFTDPNGKTLTFSKTWQFNYADYKNGKQYSYSDFVNGTLKEAGSGGCVTPDTLVTLADGTQVRIDSLTGNEKLLVWNHNTGKLEAAPVAYIVNHDNVAEKVEVIGLCFSDGKVLNVINEHVLYNLTLNKYVAIGSDNAEDFIGHEFASLDGDRLNKISLTDVKRTVKVTEIYEVVSYKHLTCFTNGVLSTSAYLDKLLNIFDIDEQTLTYSSEKIAADIEQYGLYAYEDFEGLISEEAFELYDAQYLKIAVGKGYITWDDILDLIDIYFNVGVSPIQ